MTYRLYTDGGCHGNPGPGGWAYRYVDENDRVVSQGSGYEARTTNNRMELSAVIEALGAHAGLRPLTVITDSRYVRNGISDWIHSWKRNGWRTSAKQPVKNAELWRRLDAISEGVRWAWVKGHSGQVHNEACDAMVQAELARYA